jgi:hypothetical protein
MKDKLEHGLKRDEAKQALKKAFESYRERFSKYNPQATWTDDYTAEFSFNAKGLRLEGKVTVEEDVMDVELDVPMVLRVFKGKAMDVIRDEIDKWKERVDEK